MKLISQAAVLAAALSASVLGVGGCSPADPRVAVDEAGSTGAGSTGAVRMSVRLGEGSVTSASAVLSGSDGFQTQMQTVDVSGDAGVVSIFFDGLPVGGGYTVVVTAGPCSGSSSFEVLADQTTLADVTLNCENGSGEASEMGNVQVPGAQKPEGDPTCQHITRLAAAPTLQEVVGAVTSVEVVLDSDVVPTSITWSVSSINGGAGAIVDLEGDTDHQVSFDCTANGDIQLEVSVTALEGPVSCTEQGRVSLECVTRGVSPAPPSTVACGSCVEANCGLQRASVDANFAAVDPILDCVLGATWEAGERAPVASCANQDLLTCYCGTVEAQDCVNTAPASLDGPCVAQVLTGTTCATSACVAPIFLNLANANGKAMQYAQCQQDFCYDDCFNL